jgi:hypothetical protein
VTETGTDPLDVDTDDGGRSDGDEVNTTAPIRSIRRTTCRIPTATASSDDEEDDSRDEPDRSRLRRRRFSPTAREVHDYGTDPLDADTDDGGVNDGDEVDAGTDPLDGKDDVPTVATMGSATTAAGDDTGREQRRHGCGWRRRPGR